MPGKKENNTRKFPEANHQPRHNAKFRQDEAKDRQKAYDDLTPQQKLNRLDRKLGQGVGAVKQRGRLLLELARPNVEQKTPSNKQGLAWDAPGMQAPGISQ